MMWAAWLALAAAQSSAEVAMADADASLAQERRENDAALRKAAKALGWDQLPGQPGAVSSQALHQQRQQIDDEQDPDESDDLGVVPQMAVKTTKSEEEQVADQKDHVVHLLSMDLHIIRKAQDSFERCLNQTDEAVAKVVKGGMRYGFLSANPTGVSSSLLEAAAPAHRARLLAELRAAAGAAEGDLRRAARPALASALELEADGAAETAADASRGPTRGGFLHDKEDHFLGIDRLVSDIATLREAHEAFAGCVAQSEAVAATVTKHAPLFADYVKMVDRVIAQKGEAAPRSLQELAEGLRQGTAALAGAATRLRRADAPKGVALETGAAAAPKGGQQDRTELAFLAEGLSPASFLEEAPGDEEGDGEGEAPARRLRRDLSLATGDVRDVRRAEHRMEAELGRIALDADPAVLHGHLRRPAARHLAHRKKAP